MNKIINLKQIEINSVSGGVPKKMQPEKTIEAAEKRFRKNLCCYKLSKSICECALTAFMLTVAALLAE